MNRLINLAKSLEGAAADINLAEITYPTPTKQETESLESLTVTIISMMGKYDETTRTKGAPAPGKGTTMKESETIFTEGLGSVIGLRRACRQSLEDYITVILLWLLQGGTDFSQDRYLQELVTDSQSIA